MKMNESNVSARSPKSQSNNQGEKDSSNPEFENATHSIESRTVFVGDLSYFCNENHLRELYSTFGPLEMVQIKSTKVGEPHLAYGFVRFQHPDAAMRAIQSTDGFILLGRAIRVALAADNPNQKISGSTLRSGIAKDVPTAQIHISFKAVNTNFVVTEMTLRELYQQYGEIVDVTIKKSTFDQFRKLQTGYGFVHYPLSENGIMSATFAIQYTNLLTVQSVTFECSLSRGLKDYLLAHNLLIPETNQPPQQSQRQQQHQNQRRTISVALAEPYQAPPPAPAVLSPPNQFPSPASMMYPPPTAYAPLMVNVPSLPNQSNYPFPSMNYSLPSPVAMYPYPLQLPAGYPNPATPAGIMPSPTSSSSPMSVNPMMYGNYYPSQNDRGFIPPTSSSSSSSPASYSHPQQWPYGYNPYPER